MVEFILLGIALMLIGFVLIICIRELYINHYNPLPKFQNGDRRLDDIEFIKTRTIEDKFQQVNTDN